MMAPDFQTEPNQHASEPSSKAARPSERLFPNSVLKWAPPLLLAYFAARLIFLALSVASFVPPDEFTHAGLCKIFSKVLLLPHNSPETYQFGLVTNTPWLYYWIMGKSLHLNILALPDLVFLRLLNIPLAFGTVWYALRLLRLLTDDRLTRLLLLVVLTNTAMFSLLSASVSYDNLTNLLAAMAIYYQCAFFRERSGRLLVFSLISQAAGCLTKITFLPLILALNVLLLIYEGRNLRSLPTAIVRFIQTSTRRTRIAILLLLLGAILNFHLYAGNYLRYGMVNPTMSDVFPTRIAMQFGIVARETIFRLYTEDKISYMEALQLTGEIKHPGNKADTFYLLMNYENLKRNPHLWMGLLAYTRVWLETEVATIFGIKGHLIMTKDRPYFIPYYVVMALAFLGFLLRWRPKKSGWLPLSLAGIICFYAGFILYEINYNAYLYYGAAGLTLQGRYLFPLLGPFFVLMCIYVIELFRPRYIRTGLALSTALLFISYDFPWFLAHATPEWFSRLPH